VSAALSDVLEAEAELVRRRQRGRRWVADPADAMSLRGIPAIGPRGVPSAVRGSTPHRDAPSLR
jgi:hypothetical protein